MRITLTTSAWIEHDPTWIPRPEADALLEALRHELAWEQREVVLFGRRVLQPSVCSSRARGSPRAGIPGNASNRR